MRMIDLDELLKFPIRLDHYDKENGNEHFVYGVESVLEYAENLPVVEAEPVRHGRWETIDPSFSSVYCSECGAATDKYLAKRYKGCPFCLCVMPATGTNVGGKGGNG